MMVSLYVSRLVLQALGVSDYGVYNAVGGVVGMFALISNSLVAATQRYISYELGKESGNPSLVFSLAMGLHITIVIVIVIMAETVGVWFLNAYMNFPPNRLVAANWVFQFSLLAFIINILTIPYNAVVIAEEKMGFYALISLIEALFKLFFAFILIVFIYGKLIVYAASFVVVSLSVFLLYYLYCHSKFKKDCKFQIIKELSKYSGIGGLIGWNFIGSTATVLSKQGVNILLNIFLGVIVNAGRGIAGQVDNAVNQFLGSFTTAVRPQITKTYAAGEYTECFKLINQGSKMILYLTLFLVTPLTLRTEFILGLWLGVVPDYAVDFTRLSFLIVVLDALSTPLYFLMLATGKIRDYQLVAGFFSMLMLPLTWLALRLGMNPNITYFILFVIDVIRWILQLYYLRKTSGFNVCSYMKESIIPIFYVFFISCILCFAVNKYFSDDMFGFFLFLIVTSFIILICMFAVGLNSQEKASILRMTFQLFK